jgi:hypothetical protein
VAGDQGIADVGPADGRLHARAADHGSRRQRDRWRVAGSPLRRGHHGADRFFLQELQRPRRKTRCGTQPLRRRLPVPQEDVGEGGHGPQGRRRCRDGPTRHAGSSVCKSGGRVRDWRTVWGGRSAPATRGRSA